MEDLSKLSESKEIRQEREYFEKIERVVSKCMGLIDQEKLTCLDARNIARGIANRIDSTIATKKF